MTVIWSPFTLGPKTVFYGDDFCFRITLAFGYDWVDYRELRGGFARRFVISGDAGGDRVSLWWRANCFLPPFHEQPLAAEEGETIRERIRAGLATAGKVPVFTFLDDPPDKPVRIARSTGWKVEDGLSSDYTMVVRESAESTRRCSVPAYIEYKKGWGRERIVVVRQELKWVHERGEVEEVVGARDEMAIYQAVMECLSVYRRPIIERSQSTLFKWRLMKNL